MGTYDSGFADDPSCHMGQHDEDNTHGQHSVCVSVCTETEHPDVGGGGDSQGADQVSDDGGKAGDQDGDELNQGQRQNERYGDDPEGELDQEHDCTSNHCFHVKCSTPFLGSLRMSRLNFSAFGTGLPTVRSGPPAWQRRQHTSRA